MLLTLNPTIQNGFGGSSHAYSPAQYPSSSSFSPSQSFGNAGALPPLPDRLPRRMSTPHRGLPPPAAMTLPNPDRGQPSTNLPLGQLPAAPSQWQGADESMRNWLQAKSEEDRRRQEEEKTHQESLRLEQRKIEQTMLRESLQGGVPPYMVPMVFAGIGGGNLANASLEWAQHYMAQISLQQQAQLQQQQQQQQAQAQSRPQVQTSPEQGREARLLAGPQPNPYAAQQATQAANAQSSQLPVNTGFAPSYHASSVAAERAKIQQQPLQAAPPSSNSRVQTSSALPRLNTVEMQIQPPSSGPSAIQLGGQHPLQQTQNAPQQDQPSSSPAIYFHHWVPPASQSGSKDPPTPSGKSQHDSPYSQNQTSHLRSEYTNSPKKRKATGPHHAAPPPTSNPNETSPSFSQTSAGSTPGRRRGHSRQRSDTSSRAPHEPARYRGRTESGRQSLSEAESGSQRHNSVQSETRQSQRHPTGSEMRRESRGERELRDSPKREPEGPS